MSSYLLNILSQFKSFSDNLSSILEELNKSVENVLNLNLINNLVEIKVCRSDLKIIKFNQKSHQFKCFWPKFQFKANKESELKTHKLIHKNEKQFKCNECNKELSQKRGLQLHKTIHSNQRKYKCNECNKRLTQSSSLKTHRLIDLNKREFVCDWSECGKRYKTKASLTNHKRFVHLNERKYLCNECQNRFCSKNHLKIHKRIHSGEKPFVCDHKNCCKRFTQKSNLLKHLKRH